MLIDFNADQNFMYFSIALLAFLAIGYAFGLIQASVWGRERKQRSLNSQRGVVKGMVSEQLAPYLPGFPEDLKPSEAMFMGKPIDFIVFKGMNDKNISEVVFVEVKSGRHYLNPNESSLRQAIEQKRVRYVPYQIPSEVFNTNHVSPSSSNPQPTNLSKV